MPLQYCVAVAQILLASPEASVAWVAAGVVVLKSGALRNMSASQVVHEIGRDGTGDLRCSDQSIHHPLPVLETSIVLSQLSLFVPGMPAIYFNWQNYP